MLEPTHYLDDDGSEMHLYVNGLCVYCRVSQWTPETAPAMVRVQPG